MHHSKPTTSSCGRCMHSQHMPLPNQTHPLRRRKHDTGEKRMVGRHKREEKGRLANQQWGHFYAPLACHYILTPPMHACY